MKYYVKIVGDRSPGMDIWWWKSSEADGEGGMSDGASRWVRSSTGRTPMSAEDAFERAVMAEDDNGPYGYTVTIVEETDG